MLDWEESVFVGLKSIWRRLVVTPKEKESKARQASLRDMRQELFLLGHLVSGRPIELFETDEDRLWAEQCIFLPTHISEGPTEEVNRDIYRVKTIVGALALREDWRLDIRDLLGRSGEEFPALADKVESIQKTLPPEKDIYLLLGRLPTISKTGDKTAEELAPIVEHRHLDSGREAADAVEIDGKGRTNVEVVESREDFGTGSEMPEHVFEKVETIEEYDGQSRKSEADDDLLEHEEALNDLNMNQVMRSTERPASIYRADLMLDSAGFELGDDDANTGIPYPEWDYRKRRHRKNWCFVKENYSTETKVGWGNEVSQRHRQLIRQMRRQFATVSSDWLRVKRQPFGPDFDIDAVVSSEIDRQSGFPPNEMIYQDRKRDLLDCAALFLFDQSYSTESWLDNARVLDTIRETIFCCGEVIGDYVESFAIAGFSSNTRRHCRFDWIKDFRSPWDSARDRMGSVRAEGYTRMGPALRHAQEKILNVSARRKVIILVTDGRPCDYDRYEGSYGIHDVKKALETGRREGIQTHAYAIEKRAAEYFPKMFTPDHYDIIPKPDQLAHHLCRLFLRLKS